jgi:hypothetical protein
MCTHLDLMPPEDNVVKAFMSTVQLIAASLDTAHDRWRDHLQSIRDITAVLEFSDTHANESRMHWQLPLVTVFQRVAYAEPDSGGVSDIANWCLKQAVTLNEIYPDNIELLTRKSPHALRVITTHNA